MASTTKKAADAKPASTQNATAGAGDTPPPAPTPPAAVRQQQYDAGEGWDLGQRAPEDRFVEVGPDGADVGKPSNKAPAGKYSRQISVKGAPVDASQRAALGLDK